MSDAKTTPQKKADAPKSAKPVFEVYKAEVRIGEDGKRSVELLRKIREVKIAEAQAEALNRGLIDGGNSHTVELYVRPGAKAPYLGED